MKQKAKKEKKKKREKLTKERRKRELNANNKNLEGEDVDENLFALGVIRDETSLDAVHKSGVDGQALPADALKDEEGDLFSDDEISQSDEDSDARQDRMEQDLDAAYEKYKERRNIQSVARKGKKKLGLDGEDDDVDGDSDEDSDEDREDDNEDSADEVELLRKVKHILESHVP